MQATTRFEIYSKELLVGWSELELGDPLMGVALGKFIPALGYSQIQSLVAAEGMAREDLNLSARIPNGSSLQCLTVSITDYSADLGASGLEVSVFGICNPPYEQLFPHHVAAYERQFPGGS